MMHCCAGWPGGQPQPQAARSYHTHRPPPSARSCTAPAFASPKESLGVHLLHPGPWLPPHKPPPLSYGATSKFILRSSWRNSSALIVFWLALATGRSCRRRHTERLPLHPCHHCCGIATPRPRTRSAASTGACVPRPPGSSPIVETNHILRTQALRGALWLLGDHELPQGGVYRHDPSLAGVLLFSRTHYTTRC